MNKKIFYSFLFLTDLASLYGGIDAFFSFLLFSLLIFLFVEKFEKKEIPLEHQVLFFFSLTAFVIIVSSLCIPFCKPELNTPLPSIVRFFAEALILFSAITAGALYVATCFTKGTKTSAYFLLFGLLLFLAATIEEKVFPLMVLFFFFFGLTRAFIDWLTQRSKFWLLLGILVGWAFIIGMQKGTLVYPEWSSGTLLSSFIYRSILRFILTASIAFALYLPMSLILGSRKTRMKAATSYIFLSVIPIVILLTFLWVNFFLQVGIFQLYLIWKENVDVMQDLTNTCSEELGTFIKSHDLQEKQSLVYTDSFCQKYEDFLALMFTKPAALVTIFPPDSDKPIIQAASRNASLINPSRLLYPEWVKNESMSWLFLENGKLYLKGVQFNNYGNFRVFVRLYVPLEFQDLKDFEREYKLSLQLDQQLKPAQSPPRAQESPVPFSLGEALWMINEGGIPLSARVWETGSYVRAGSIFLSSPQYFSEEEKSSPLYSVILFGLLLAGSFMAFVVIVFSSILGYIINRNMRRSFDAIVDGAHHFSGGDFDHRIPLMSKDEYSIIGGSLNQMAIGIKQYTEEMIKKELMERELSIASEVQKRIFPKGPPSLKGFDFGIISKPYGKVGGDYYDFIEYPEGELAVVIADASGKGIPAALMVSSLSAILHSYSRPDRLAEFLSTINSRLWKVATENAYITLVFCLFQTNGKDIRYVNAGHPHPLILNGKQEFIPLLEGGASLGMFDSIELREGTIQMKSRETMIFVTDGILETTNVSGDEFGGERLKEIIIEHHLGSAQAIAESIFEKLKAFSGSEQFVDDATCIVIKKL